MMGAQSDSSPGVFGAESALSLEDLEAELRRLVILLDQELKRSDRPGERDRRIASVFAVKTEGHIYVLSRLPPVEWQRLCVQEKRVAISVRKGHSNKEIATELDITTCTVNELMRRIFAKLGPRNRVKLALMSLVETEKEISKLFPEGLPPEN